MSIIRIPFCTLISSHPKSLVWFGEYQSIVLRVLNILDKINLFYLIEGMSTFILSVTGQNSAIAVLKIFIV